MVGLIFKENINNTGLTELTSQNFHIIICHVRSTKKKLYVRSVFSDVEKTGKTDSIEKPKLIHGTTYGKIPVPKR